MVNDKNFYELTGKENNKSNNYDVYQKFRMKDGKIYKQIDENGINLKIFWSFPAIFLFLISSLIHFEVRIYLDFSFTLPVPSGVSYDP